MRISVILILVLALCAKARAASSFAADPPPPQSAAVFGRFIDVHPDRTIVCNDSAESPQVVTSDGMDGDSDGGGDLQAIGSVSRLSYPCGHHAAPFLFPLWPPGAGLHGLRICRNNR